MAGSLFITEYNVYGDVSVGLLLEPSSRVQKVAIGEISAQLDHDTRAVALFADLPCRIQFITDGVEPDAAKAWPITDNYEIQRLIHMGTKQRVAVFPLDD